MQWDHVCQSMVSERVAHPLSWTNRDGSVGTLVLQAIGLLQGALLPCCMTYCLRIVYLQWFQAKVQCENASTAPMLLL